MIPMASLITTKAIMSHHHVLSSTRITTLCSDKAIDNQQRKTKLQISHRFFSRRRISGIATAVINSASPVPEKETVEDERRCHVAWTSVQQEKWEGELTVQGKIPTWLLYSWNFTQICIVHTIYTHTGTCILPNYGRNDNCGSNNWARTSVLGFKKISLKMASLITTKAIMSHHHVLSSTRITTLCSDKAIDNQQRKTKLQISHRFFSRRTISAAVINSASPVPKKETVEDERRCHVAWTSVQQEKWEGELTVQGKIPTWLNGTYLRNGPGLWNIGDHDFRHLFDGYSTLVKLEFDDGRIFSGHRLLESDAYKAAKKHKKLCYREFSETPKPSRSNFKNPFSGVGEIVKLFSGESLTDNANTGVIRLGDGRVVCLTETQKGSILVDHDTLETIGKFEYDDGLCDHMIHSAHPIVTETEMWTLIPDLVKPGYRVVRMEAGSNKREVVGRVKCRSGSWGPGWVHSFI
ncbi:hypothetical protein Bca52824_089545 [Brassica carinata]|uniref:Uncharacterized protein n=1 Tax=Brassica carinata TaxID=52824 RepID=A0A8X7TPW0_BRACI|nr:hypothetical protein Bca52824_089545 [Brassica carinata]